MYLKAKSIVGPSAIDQSLRERWIHPTFPPRTIFISMFWLFGFRGGGRGSESILTLLGLWCTLEFMDGPLGPWLLLEHRPCTTSLQRLLSWAILSSCFQLSPVCVMSASRSRRQVFFGLPLFRLPWGLHVIAYLVMLVFGFLSVWPSHPHLLLIS